MDISFTLSGTPRTGRLPLMGTRFRLHTAHMIANGLLDLDGNTVETASSDELDIDVDMLSSANAAAIGLCWRGAALADDPLGLPPLRKFGHDIFDYGDAVFEQLMKRGVSLGEIVTEGGRVLRAILATIPTEEALEEAMDPTGGPAEDSTGTTSESG